MPWRARRWALLLALACTVPLTAGGGPTPARAEEAAPPEETEASGPRAEGEEGEAAYVIPVTEAPWVKSLGSSGWDAAELLGREVAPGERRRLFLRASESFAGAGVDLPVLVLRGTSPGPTLCLTAGIHGDELNGIEIVRKVFETLRPDALSGMLLGVPVANLHGFRRSSRYLPDRRDLNRYFPGHPEGSSASRIASSIFEGVVRRCDALVDYHTGSFHRSNLPQVRANLRERAILDLARGFGGGVVVHSEGVPGTLRRAAAGAGIPAITYEAGEPMRFQGREIERGVRGTRSLLASLGMLDGAPDGLGPPQVYYRSLWVRVDDGGIFLTDRPLGQRVRAGALLGTVTDPVSNERSKVIAPFGGRIIGRALSQVVIPGFAAFHIGIDTRPPPEVGAGPPDRAPADARRVPTPTPDQLDAEEQPE